MQLTVTLLLHLAATVSFVCAGVVKFESSDASQQGIIDSQLPTISSSSLPSFTPTLDITQYPQDNTIGNLQESQYPLEYETLQYYQQQPNTQYDQQEQEQKPYSDTQSRTFGHLHAKFKQAETRVASFLSRYLGPYFQPMYYDYNDNGEGGYTIWRKDQYRPIGDAHFRPKQTFHGILKKIATIPKYLTRHPINFKKHFVSRGYHNYYPPHHQQHVPIFGSNTHGQINYEPNIVHQPEQHLQHEDNQIHHVGKRSIADNSAVTSPTYYEIPSAADFQSAPINDESTGRTLSYFFPSWQNNFSMLMSRLLGPFYNNFQQKHYNSPQFTRPIVPISNPLEYATSEGTQDLENNHEKVEQEHHFVGWTNAANSLFRKDGQPGQEHLNRQPLYRRPVASLPNVMKAFLSRYYPTPIEQA